MVIEIVYIFIKYFGS